ncbi:acyl-CoA dehydrogenase family protein [Natronorubrum daqingense]|uniref:Acyl-CoA dehydrogenase n=1 Tax=Natronorubrum daqingense TaxID=588898 RepID=A0A1N7D4S0_9EURY|nr:acyl-CoA dehydrogenase family protein [Natronorubrum daqingense]APX97208.1 acyl-CoA dehydrogenase [Natronorubrum daqingense]SIR70771.1 acyl-CoA dehydrogenase [Natronorubrum daqingense]
MDARLTEEHERVQETAREFIESEGGTDLARRQADGENVVDDLWDELAGLDYTAITVPLEYGGFGEGMVYLAALLEAAGRYALPGPLPETAAVAVPLIRDLGTDDQRSTYLPSVADGDLRLSLAVYDDETEPLPGSIQMGAERLGEAETAEFRLEGTKTLVPYAGETDVVIVATRTRESQGYDGVSLFAVETDHDAVETTRMDSLDWARPMYEFSIDGLTVDEEALIGPLHGGGSALVTAMDRFSVAGTAMLVGAADRAVELSAEYGTEREQYGQPIGRFQAVKHRTADMWVDMQGARSLVYYAAWALDGDEPDAARAAAATKSFAADRLHRVFGDDIWNHGGMGFTWDHDAHIYLKQAKSWRNFLGSPEANRDRLIDARLATERNR